MSRLAAQKLIKFGYDNVRAYEGGLEEWKAAGFATDIASEINDEESELRFE